MIIELKSRKKLFRKLKHKLSQDIKVTVCLQQKEKLLEQLKKI